MTEPNEAPNADPTRETQTINPSDVGDAGAVLGLGGVSAQATAGALDPQPGAAPAADQPAPGAPAAASTQEPAGSAPDAAAPTAATPGATDEAAGRELSDEARATVATHLNAIEQIALYWGGETGTKIRNHVGFIREQLQ